MQEPSSNLAHLATITSRPEALVIASALEHEGIPVWIDGLWHASVDPISVALGGYRLRVPIAEWGPASGLIEELGLPDADVVYAGQRHAVLKLLLVYIGYWYFWCIPGAIMGAFSASLLALVPLNTFTAIPVDPRGRNDFHLAPQDDT